VLALAYCGISAFVHANLSTPIDGRFHVKMMYLPILIACLGLAQLFDRWRRATPPVASA
jgi:hypothetical protein